jgi:HlyD family secretion protein
MNDRLSHDLASLRISRQAPAKTGRAARVGLVLALVGAAGAAAYVYGAPYVSAKLFKLEVSVTEITMVSPAQASIDLTSTGYVVPQVLAKVGPKVTGRVAKVKIQEGDRVKAGQVIFELDPTDQRSAVASAQARASAARAKAVASRAQLAEIQLQADREKRLAATGAVPQASADDLAARAKSLEEQARAAEADTAAAQAEVASLATNLGNMTIPAPIDGTAVTKPSQVGDVVTPGSTLVELADFTSIVVETDVPEGRLHLVKAGGPCEIVLDAFPDKRYRGTVREISPRLDRAKATATVKVRFEDAGDEVLPEMAARVSFLEKPLDQAELQEPSKRVVPGPAVVDRGGVKQVFVLDGDKVRMTPVKLGDAVGSGFELKEGPPPGTKVIRDPPPQLGDGQDVKERSSS